MKLYYLRDDTETKKGDCVKWINWVDEYSGRVEWTNKTPFRSFNQDKVNYTVRVAKQLTGHDISVYVEVYDRIWQRKKYRKVNLDEIIQN